MADEDRLEFALPCGHISVSLVCFHCAIEAFAVDEGATDRLETPGAAGPSRPSGQVQPKAGGEPLELLLPCGHKSTSPACFHCESEEFAADERVETAAAMPKPPVPAAGPSKLTISVMHPPCIQRFAAGRRKK